MSSTAGVARADTADLTRDIPLGPASGYIDVADGTSLLAHYQDMSDAAHYFLSADGGKSWRAANGLAEFCATGCRTYAPREGVLAVQPYREDRIAVYSLDNDSLGTPLDFPQSTADDDGTIVAAWGARILGRGVGDDRWLMDLSQPSPSKQQLPVRVQRYFGLTDDGAASFVYDSGAHTLSFVSVTAGDHSSTTTVGTVAASGLLSDPNAVGGTAYYDVAGHSCYFRIPQPSDHGCADTLFDTATFAENSVVSNSNRVTTLYLDGDWSHPHSVELASGYDNVSWPGVQTGGLPYYVESGTTFKQLAADGTSSAVSRTDWESPVRVDSLSLTPTSLVGLHSGTGWVSSVGSSLGDFTSLGAVKPTDRASAVASAGRWILPAPGGASIYDGGQKVGAIDKALINVTKLSGPYLLAEQGDKPENGSIVPVSVITGLDGTTKVDGDAADIFGSLELRYSARENNEYQVSDLTHSSPDINVTMPPGSRAGGSYSNAQIWGDWIAGDRSSSNDRGDVNEVVVHNFRNAADPDRVRAGHLITLGDGFAVIRDSGVGGAFEVWNFRTDAVTPLSIQPSTPISVDGRRVAYADYAHGSFVVKDLGAGYAQSSPRALGVVAASSFDPTKGVWSAAIDLTKPVAAGQLEVRTAAGDLIRTVPVGASLDGSLRGITWDGKKSDGTFAPAGTYTVALTNAASDGTGRVVRVDGTSVSIAAVTLTLPPITAGVATISGAAAVGGALVANPGSWTPGTRVGYQWLRDGAPIPGANGATYSPSVADLGAAIAVQIHGSILDGAVSATAVSAAVGIREASLTATPTPGVAGRWAYRQTVSAVPGAWQPAPVSLTYQWVRDGVPIPGASAVSYRLAGADVGHRIAVRVTGSKPGFGTVAATSVASFVTGTKFAKTPAPKITGTAKVKKTLAVRIKKWSPKASFAYQWLRDGAPISGATGTRYKVTALDKGKKLSVVVTGTAPGYYPVSKPSSATKKVA